MYKKEKFKKYMQEHKDELVEVVINGVLIGITGIACFELGEKFALNDVAKGITELANKNLEEGKAPVNFKFVGNMFKGFKMIDMNS